MRQAWALGARAAQRRATWARLQQQAASGEPPWLLCSLSSKLLVPFLLLLLLLLLLLVLVILAARVASWKYPYCLRTPQAGSILITIK